jgi:uncharacterized RDD family membrane protein YckC/Tfp pilus assembly major pilin PilA
MEFHIGRNGQTLGPFSIEQVRRQLAEGKLSPRDLAWHDGAADWQPIDSYAELMLAPADSPPPAEPRPSAAPAAAASPRTVWSPPEAALATDEPDVVAGRDYAGFWKRFAAYIIDRMILTAAVFVCAMVIGIVLAARGNSGGPDDAATIAVIGFYAVPYIGYIFYCVLMESSRHQGTLGKMALGIVVTDLEGRRIGPGRAFGRLFASLLNNLTLAIGWMMAGWTERKQGLHDMVAGTLVLDRAPARAPTAYNRASPAAPRAAPAPSKPMPVWAIGLIVLGAMVPVLGILAAIAIPAYSDYTERAKVAEGLSAAAAYKVAITESYLNKGALPDTLEEVGVTAYSSRNVRKIDWVDHLLLISYSSARIGAGNNVLALQPYKSADGSMLVWRCGFAAEPDGATSLSEFDSAEHTTLRSAYVPSSCRAGH